MRYTPPKSSVWGHFLRKVLPSKLYKKTPKFLNELINESEVIYFFNVHEGFENCKAKYWLDKANKILKRPVPEYEDYELSESEFKEILNMLIENEKELKDTDSQILLSERYEISKLSINKEIIDTNSTIEITYGNEPHIQTNLIFRNLNDYKYIEKHFEKHKICKLNPKNIKQK